MQWGLLVRISDDRTGEGVGVERQEKDGRAEIARRGGAVAEPVYRENDTSAFKRKRVDGVLRVFRPELEKALDDLEAGRIDGLMVYDLDRLARDPRDLEDAIDVVEQTRRPIAAVTGSIDLSTDHGITAARMLVAVKNQESRDTSRRVRRVHEDLAAEGRPSGGRRPYGYTADRLQVVEEEAEVLRELARRRLAGEGWVPLLKDLNARGIPAASGGRWTLSGVRSALLKPHGAGLRVVGGQAVAAVWPAILDRSTWEQLRALSHEHRPPTRRYYLSGIARCGLCGEGLAGRKANGVPIYRCPPGGCARISRRADPLDDYIAEVMLVILADADLTPPEPPADPELARQLAEVRDRRAAVVAAFADVAGKPPAELRRTLDKLDADIARVTAKAASGQRHRLQAQVRGMTRAQWDALPLDTRRAVTAAVVEVTVGPSARGRVPFDTSSVTVVPRP